MKNHLIYVAGPYSKGDPVMNTRRAMRFADRLINVQQTPIVPHLSMFQHLNHPRDYEEWLALDFRIIKHCTLLIRLSGSSSGADREVSLAESLGTPTLVQDDEDHDDIFLEQVVRWLDHNPLEQP